MFVEAPGVIDATRPHPLESRIRKLSTANQSGPKRESS
jgi:hypothetical protein